MDKNISLHKIRNEAVIRTLQPNSGVTSAEAGSPVVLNSSGEITVPASSMATVSIHGILISRIPSGWATDDDYEGSLVALTTADTSYTVRIGDSVDTSTLVVGTKYVIAKDSTTGRWELTSTTTDGNATLLGIIENDAIDGAYAIVRIDHA